MNYINDIVFVFNQNIALQYFIVILLGLFLGSFLNVLVGRLIIMENLHLANIAKSLSEKVNKDVDVFLDKFSGYNLFLPASTCPKCGHQIKFYENIPIIGFFLLKGKCSNCDQKISFEYPLVEFITTAMFAVSYYFYGATIDFVLHVGLFYLLIACVLSDLKSRLLFDSLLLMIFALGFYAASTLSFQYAFQQFTLAILVYFSIYSFIVIFETLTKRENHSFGRGDIKLFAALSIWLSLFDLLYVVIISCVVGILYYLVLYVFKRDILKSYIAFAPFIIIAFLLVYLPFK